MTAAPDSAQVAAVVHELHEIAHVLWLVLVVTTCWMALTVLGSWTVSVKELRTVPRPRR